MNKLDFQNEVPVLFKKYKIKKKIGQGAFGSVYLGKSIADNKLVAIKVEKKNVQRPSLEAEAYLLLDLKGLGIPEMLSFGNAKSYRVLVEPLLGQNLFDIFVRNGMQLPLEDICLISIQVIERIQFVHSRYIIHRDIKPDNFLIGKEDPNVIYIVDFGLSKKYRSSTTKKHVPFRITGKLTGTMRFSSPNALRGGEQSRKDDLISIGYMIIYFMRKKLPWQQFNRVKNDIEKYIRIYKMKKEMKPEQLCKNLPSEMVHYMRYVQKLGFEQEPDYKYLKDLFRSILKKKNENYDKLLFSWIKASDIPHLKKAVNPKARKSSSRERLWKKINDNLKKREDSSESSEHHSYEQASKVRVNGPNIKMVRNNSKDTFDTSMISSENFKTGNTKTLFVNLEKTINNQLITSLKVIDMQNESKDSKTTKNEMTSFEKDKSKQSANTVSIFNNLSEKESGSINLEKLPDNNSDIKVNNETIKQKDMSLEELYKKKILIQKEKQFKEKNIQQKKNIMPEEQRIKLQNMHILKDKGQNQLLNNINMNEDLNKVKIKEKMMKMKKDKLNQIRNEGATSNKNVLINKDIENKVQKLFKNDNNNDNNDNSNEIKGNNIENEINNDMMFNSDENIQEKNNLYKEKKKFNDKNIINKQNLEIKNINNNKKQLINKNKINNINSKDNYINTENRKNQYNMKNHDKINRNIRYNPLYNPEPIALTEPSDTTPEFDTNMFSNQSDQKNINVRKMNFYKASNKTFQNLNNYNNNFGMKLDNPKEKMDNYHFPDDSGMNERVNQKKKNNLKNKNNMNKPKMNDNVRQFELSMKDNIFQVNDLDNEIKFNKDFNPNEKQDMLQQKIKKNKNLYQNNNYNNQNNIRNNYKNQNNNYNIPNDNFNYMPLNQKPHSKQIPGNYPNYNNMEQRFKMEEPNYNFGNLGDDMDFNF